MQDVVAREFERSEAIVGKDHDLIWAAMLALAENRGEVPATLIAAQRLTAAGLIAPASSQTGESAGETLVVLALDDYHQRLFRESVATIEAFRASAAVDLT
jgi:hypothetical protein